MAVASGTLGSVVWNGTIVAHTTSWEMNSSQNLPEVTPQGVAWREYIAGIRDATFSTAFDFEMTGQQAVIQNAILNGESGSARFYVTATNYYEASTIFPTSNNVNTSFDDAARGNFEFRASGPISYN